MPIPQVLPKFELKELFESGDLITEATLDQFIDASYNHTLVGGANVTLTSVSGPSGTTITINSSSGGGTGTVTSASNIGAGTGLFYALIGTDLQFKSLVAGSNIAITNTGTEVTIAATSSGTTYQGGDGINIDTATAPDTIAIDLYTTGCAPEGPNLEFTSNKLNFKGLHIRDEGTAVGSFQTINFIGSDVLAQTSGDPCVVDVYIPPPQFASHWNTTDGITAGTVLETLSRSTVRISTPTGIGNPFSTNGWEGTNQPATLATTPDFGPASTGTNGLITGFSAPSGGTQDATMTVTFYDADGVTILSTYTTATLNGNGTYTNGLGISVVVTNHAADVSKWKANIRVNVNSSTILTAQTRSGGRYHITCVMNTDTGTDGGGTYTYTQADVFYDTNLTTPTITGSMSLVESTTPANILTKHLSGVEYYIINSEFKIDTTGMQNLNENTQGYSFGTTRNFRITGTEYGLTSYNLQAWSPSQGSMINWTNQFDVPNVDYTWASWPITATNYRYRGTTANGTTQVYDPWANGTIQSSPNSDILIDTVTATPTNLGESFNNESERLIRGAASYTAWDPLVILGSNISNQTGASSPFSDACSVGSYIVRPDKYFLSTSGNPDQPDLSLFKPWTNKAGTSGTTNPNYTTYTNTAVYNRRFYTASAKSISNISLAFGGSAGTNGSNWGNALANNDLKIYVRREASPNGGSIGHGANPLSVHGVLYDSGQYNDGSSGADTLGAAIRTQTNSSNVICTFGSFFCTTGFWIEVQLVDPTIEIEFINCTLEFTDASTETNPV